jgi:hypothetical protein
MAGGKRKSQGVGAIVEVTLFHLAREKLAAN